MALGSCGNDVPSVALLDYSQKNYLDFYRRNRHRQPSAHHKLLHPVHGGGALSVARFRNCQPNINRLHRLFRLQKMNGQHSKLFCQDLGL